MNTLMDALQDAGRRGVALGHFNVSDLSMVNRIVAVARELATPVLIGVSEGERDFMGVHQIAAVIRSIREKQALPVFLNADHTHDMSRAVEAAEAGFDMIVFDGSALPFEENVERTRQAVAAIKRANPSTLVEGELGYLGSSSTLHDKLPDDLSPLTSADEAQRFVQMTGVDVLAPAVGSMHGMLRSPDGGAWQQKLDLERIRLISASTPAFLTLHGGSGTPNDVLSAAVQAGIRVVHINTELRVAWRRGLEQALAAHPEEIVPYRLLPAALTPLAEVVREHLEVLGSSVATAQPISR